MAASDFQAVWSASEVYAFRGWVPSVRDAGWGRRPPPPPPPLRLELLDYVGCLVIVLVVCITALHFRGFLLDDEYSIVNVLALLLTRIMHMLVMKSSPAPSSWTALALLPTCPAPALSTPPVCYEWEKPAAAMVLPVSSGSAADSNWRSNEQDCDYTAARKCFDSLVRDAAWTCDEQDDYNAAMKCFDSLVHNAASICFVCSYDAIPLTRQFDDPPPT
ncbi:hypothetical protein BDA96_08G198700 [Sorghum bicolor]|uniref:Uncharacterized protein n=1 Tax=Sorghum bicolor TaxID=4558 RepID=A0A921QH18_SORBI|nr:hypothetical protein BDA96_08G198700 [Sorghum bicolor]